MEKFPTMTFKSTGVKATGDGELAVKGDLTIHGVTRKATFDGRRADCAGERSVGQHADRGLGDHQDQPQGLRPDLECGAGDRRHSGGRGSDDHARCAVCESLKFRRSVSRARRKSLLRQRREELCHSVR